MAAYALSSARQVGAALPRLVCGATPSGGVRRDCVCLKRELFAAGTGALSQCADPRIAILAIDVFMVIERFPQHDMLPVYRQVREGGRALPDGLTYIDSWVEPNFSRCFQLMECEIRHSFSDGPWSGATTK